MSMRSILKSRTISRNLAITTVMSMSLILFGGEAALAQSPQEVSMGPPYAESFVDNGCGIAIKTAAGAEQSCTPHPATRADAQGDLQVSTAALSGAVIFNPFPFPCLNCPGALASGRAGVASSHDVPAGIASIDYEVTFEVEHAAQFGVEFPQGSLVHLEASASHPECPDCFSFRGQTLAAPVALPGQRVISFTYMNRSDPALDVPPGQTRVSVSLRALAISSLFRHVDTRSGAVKVIEIRAVLHPRSASTNEPPTASFTSSCSGLTCSFDASGSSDPDGSITGYSWDFGDGSGSSAPTTSHTYSAGGTYTVTLRVADDHGASATTSQDITVSKVALTARGYKVKGLHKADLSWTGAGSTQVDVYRDGVVIATTDNDGLHTDDINRKGSAAYVYKVCEPGTTTCSNEATVRF